MKIRIPADWVLALIVVCFTVVALVYKNPPDGSTDWAAWVQAVGSLVAIAVAICVTRYQTDRARREKIEQRNFDDTRKVKILKNLYISIRDACCVIEKDFDKSDEVTDHQPHGWRAVEDIALPYFSDIRDALKQIPLWEIPDCELVMDLTFVLRWLTNFIDSTESGKEAISHFHQERKRTSTSDMEEGVEIAVAMAKKDFHNMHDRVKAAIARCDELLRNQQKA